MKIKYKLDLDLEASSIRSIQNALLTLIKTIDDDLGCFVLSDGENVFVSGKLSITDINDKNYGKKEKDQQRVKANKAFDFTNN